jgi:hypothetical protein
MIFSKCPTQEFLKANIFKIIYLVMIRFGHDPMKILGHDRTDEGHDPNSKFGQDRSE